MIWNRAYALLVRTIWDVDGHSLGGIRARLLFALRVTYVVVRDVLQGPLTLRATSLVYTTLLSLVPLLAVSFSVLKAFGVHNQVEPALENFLAPLGPKAPEITRRVIGFVENVEVGVLGAIGLAALMYTVVALIQKIEDAFNAVWGVTRSRSFAQQFGRYMSVILVGPVLVFSAVALTASIMSTRVVKTVTAMEPFGTAVAAAGQLLPYLLVIAAFTFIYLFIPNTRVSLRSALVGGVVAGVLWETIGWAFAAFVVSSTQYSAIYSGFAILILFMFWLYLSWLILLVGAAVAFYHQHPRFVSLKRHGETLSNRLKEKLGVLIMVLIGDHYYRRQPPAVLDGLVHRLGIRVEPVQAVLQTLRRQGFVLETCDDPPAYVPAKDLETIRVQDVLTAIRGAEDDESRLEGQLHSPPDVDELLGKVEAAAGAVLSGMTVKSLVLGRTEP